MSDKIDPDEFRDLLLARQAELRELSEMSAQARGAVELDQEPIPHSLDHAPAVLCDFGIKERRLEVLQPSNRPFFIVTYEARIANRVGSNNGREAPSLDLLLGH